MTANFRTFARDIERAKRSLLAAPLLRAKQDLARTALTRLIARTPAVTGHARANWQVSIGTPATGVVAGVDPSGDATLSSGLAAIMADRDPFSIVWIVNNTPYIQRLEQGDSNRAPADIVATTIAELRRAR